jgi:nickel transport protein
LAVLFVLVSVVVTFVAPSAARAHKVNVFAHVEGDTVITESYFNDGRKCRDSTIEVFDKHGHKLAEGKTDAEGRFSFQPSVRTDLVIRLTASMGHRAEYTVLASDLPEKLPAAPGAAAHHVEDAPADNGHSHAGEDEHATDIEDAVERVVARQLAPIRRELEESRRRRRFSDVVGGIGYIVGVMGVIFYFLGRRRRE